MEADTPLYKDDDNNYYLVQYFQQANRNDIPFFPDTTRSKLLFMDSDFSKKNQNAPRPSEHPPVRGEQMSKRLGGIKGCKYKTIVEMFVFIFFAIRRKLLGNAEPGKYFFERY